MTPKVLEEDADNEHGSLALCWIGGQDHDRVIEAAGLDIYTGEKAFVDVAFLRQPQDATGLKSMVLTNCTSLAARRYG